MILKDRKLLARLIVLQDWSVRGLATASGFRSHSYLNRMVHGKVRSCSAERATALAHNLGVPLDSLFLTRMSTDPEQSSRKPFRSGTTPGERPAAGHAAVRGPRRTAASSPAPAVKSA